MNVLMYKTINFIIIVNDTSFLLNAISFLFLSNNDG